MTHALGKNKSFVLGHKFWRWIVSSPVLDGYRFPFAIWNICFEDGVGVLGGMFDDCLQKIIQSIPVLGQRQDTVCFLLGNVGIRIAEIHMISEEILRLGTYGFGVPADFKS